MIQGLRKLALLGCLTLHVGCGGAPTPAEPATVPKTTVAKQTKPATTSVKKPAAKPRAANEPTTEDPLEKPPRPRRDPPPILGDLLKTKPGEEELNFYQSAPRPEIDDAKVAAHGIRKLTGEHLTLYTDLPASPEIDELPRVFDAAVPQWQAYFGVAETKVAKWRIWGYLVQDKAKFQAAGLYPDDLPDFANGYQRGFEFWLLEQPTTYYRRHLLLHEGTHAAMYHWLGGAGPPWYCEGMAELFGTHRWADGKLTTAYVPHDKSEVEGWGRVKIIKDAFATNTALTLPEVLKLPTDAHRQTPAYAWSWAAAEFFDKHPRYQRAFRDLRTQTKDVTAEFSTKFLTALKPEVRTMQDEWQLFVGNCEYGYDVARNSLDVKPAVSLPAAGAKVDIVADHAWQSSGYKLEADKTYRLSATGRYQLASQPKVWWCEPGGVTIRYYRGLPLGMLVAAVRDDEQPQGITPLLTPVSIGLGTDFTPKQAGTLWLKINDHPGELSDNVGKLSVSIVPP